MMVNQSVTGALVGLVLIALVAGFVMGTSFADADILNPYRSQAEAERIRQETAIQAQREAIDLQTYQQEQDLRLKALKQQLADERAYRLALQETKIFILRAFGITAAITIGLAAFILSIALAFRILAQARRLWIQSSAEGQALRERVRRLARENERLTRRLGLLEQETTTVGGDNGHREEVPIL
ncbi:MAG: hypothetical protein RML46_09635 [Anaerolineae bacterium]|nr:hypothetical protein [Anaerolineae bacterium]